MKVPGNESSREQKFQLPLDRAMLGSRKSTLTLVPVLERNWQTLGGISHQRGIHTDELWLQTILEAAQRWCFSDVFV